MSQSFSNGGADEHGDVYPASFDCEDCGLSLSWPVTEGVPASQDPVAIPMLEMIAEHDAGGCEQSYQSPTGPEEAAGNSAGVTRAEVAEMIAAAILPMQADHWNAECIMAGEPDKRVMVRDFQNDSMKAALSQTLGVPATLGRTPKAPWLVAPLQPADLVGQPADVARAFQPLLERLDLVLQSFDAILRALPRNFVVHQSSPSVGAPNGAGVGTPQPTDGEHNPGAATSPAVAPDPTH